MILTIRTDKPNAELGLYDGQSRVDGTEWQAHRELSNTLLKRIDELLTANNAQKQLAGIVVFKGPGSFTGLRIGITVGNSLAYGLSIPIIAQTGDDWIKQGISRLESGENEKITLPEYGAEAHITKPRK